MTLVILIYKKTKERGKKHGIEERRKQGRNRVADRLPVLSEAEQKDAQSPSA